LYITFYILLFVYFLSFFSLHFLNFIFINYIYMSYTYYPEYSNQYLRKINTKVISDIIESCINGDDCNKNNKQQPINIPPKPIIKPQIVKQIEQSEIIQQPIITKKIEQPKKEIIKQQELSQSIEINNNPNFPTTQHISIQTNPSNVQHISIQGATTQHISIQPTGSTVQHISIQTPMLPTQKPSQKPLQELSNFFTPPKSVEKLQRQREEPKPIISEKPKEEPKPIISEKPKEEPKPIISEKPKEEPKQIISEKPKLISPEKQKEETKPIISEKPKEESKPIISEKPKLISPEKPKEEIQLISPIIPKETLIQLSEKKVPLIQINNKLYCDISPLVKKFNIFNKTFVDTIKQIGDEYNKILLLIKPNNNKWLIEIKENLLKQFNELQLNKIQYNLFDEKKLLDKNNQFIIECTLEQINQLIEIDNKITIYVNQCITILNNFFETIQQHQSIEKLYQQS